MGTANDRWFHGSYLFESLFGRTGAMLRNSGCVVAASMALIASSTAANRYAEGLCSKYGWERIDVTGKAVEEVAREIITVLLTMAPPTKPTH